MTDTAAPTAQAGASALPASAAGLIDLDRLLAPISEAQPAGPALDKDPVQQKLAELRREDDPRLPRGVWERELKLADWPGTIKLAGDTIAKRSKDLQIAVLLTEALTVRHGYAGTTAGLTLLSELCRRFWDQVHPALKAGDLSYRLSPFEWLDAKLPRRLNLLPASDPPEPAQPCSFADLQMAVHLERVSQRDAKAFKQAEAQGAVTRAVFDKSVALTRGPFYQERERACRDALAALDALIEVLDAHCGDDGLTFGGLRDTLHEHLGTLQASLRDKGLAPLDAPPAADAQPADTDDSNTSVGAEPAPAAAAREDSVTQPDRTAAPASGDPDAPVPPIRSREDAYARIAQVADYLQRTEPHSPTPYLLRRAIHWGRLDLNQLLMELTGNGMDFMQVMRLLGLGQESDSEHKG